MSVRIENNEEITTTYRLIFERVGDHSGFGFECDEHGNINEEMNPLLLENYRKCVSGEIAVVFKGILKYENRIRLCNCGSGKYPEEIYDGHGIYLCRVCDDCKSQKLKGYRLDIFENYETDEQINDETPAW